MQTSLRELANLTIKYDDGATSEAFCTASDQIEELQNEVSALNIFINECADSISSGCHLSALQAIRDRAKKRSVSPGVSSHHLNCGEIEDRVRHLEDLLITIGDFAHDRSTGPAIEDDLWGIRNMAYRWA